MKLVLLENVCSISQVNYQYRENHWLEKHIQIKGIPSKYIVHDVRNVIFLLRKFKCNERTLDTITFMKVRVQWGFMFGQSNLSSCIISTTHLNTPSSLSDISGIGTRVESACIKRTLIYQGVRKSKKQSPRLSSILKMP